IVLNNTAYEHLMMRNGTTFEFTQKRYYPHKLNFSTITDLFDSLSYYHQQKELAQSSQEKTPVEIKRQRENFERLLPDLFSIFWLSHQLGATERKVFQKILHPSYQGKAEKNLIISAITLNIWRTFDESKLLLLLDACQNNDMNVKQR